MSNIEWTDATWNPVVGCSKVSEGCRNCYAMVMGKRLASMADKGQGGRTAAYAKVMQRDGDGIPLAQWNNKVECVDAALTIPLRWRKPRMVFVNSMGDLFHPDVPFEFIDRVFAVMALCPQHTFQVLTKRPERMAEYLTRADKRERWAQAVAKIKPLGFIDSETDAAAYRTAIGEVIDNVWLGTSVEDQAAADTRIPHLLKCPTAVRFLSCEPLLGEVDLLRVDSEHFGGPKGHKIDAIRKGYWDDRWGFVNHSDMKDEFGSIDWIIVGGESGKGARPCNVEWLRSIVLQCKSAGVPVFVKQLGSRPSESSLVPASISSMAYDWDDSGECIERWYKPLDPKGGDPSEWPEPLRVREMPKGAPQ